MCYRDEALRDRPNCSRPDALCRVHIETDMIKIPTPPDIAILLDAFSQRGGVLIFEFFESATGKVTPDSHREAARLFLDERASACREYMERIDSGNPLTHTLRHEWDESKLVGEKVDFNVFWGTDDVEPKQIAPHAWSIPIVNGYKPAFFHPPHSLRGGVLGNSSLFDSINEHLLGDGDRGDHSIWSWSTDCSSFFDDGHEWWGAFLWTIELLEKPRIVVIAASATD